MTEDSGNRTPAAPEEPPAHCYRCRKPLLLSTEWCGSCGAEQTIMCRECGLVFYKRHNHCPGCGARRLRTRRSSTYFRTVVPMGAREWLHRNRRRLFYVAAGMACGILLGAIVKTLAGYSEPVSEEFPPIHSLMYWVEPFIRAGRTVFRAVTDLFGTVYDWLVLLVLNNFKTTILAVIGAVAGLVFAARREKRRRMSRADRTPGRRRR